MVYTLDTLLAQHYLEDMLIIPNKKGSERIISSGVNNNKRLQRGYNLTISPWSVQGKCQENKIYAILSAIK